MCVCVCVKRERGHCRGKLVILNLLCFDSTTYWKAYRVLALRFWQKVAKTLRPGITNGHKLYIHGKEGETSRSLSSHSLNRYNPLALCDERFNTGIWKFLYFLPTFFLKKGACLCSISSMPPPPTPSSAKKTKQKNPLCSLRSLLSQLYVPSALCSLRYVASALFS